MTVVQTDTLPPPAPPPRSTGPSYFWHIALLYVAFNVLLSPLQSWADIFMGWRTANLVLLHHPFAEGNLFFYPIVLNSDSIFRVSQQFILSRALPAVAQPTVGLITASCACLILLVFSLVDYGGWQGTIAHGGQLPATDQLLLTAASLIVGYSIHHSIVRRDMAAT